jgi:hypothetical protein
MHFRLPKPLHGWREFAGEVGIIVVGILIALGGEQLVETLHWRQEVADFREAARAEMSMDLATYEFRTKENRCVEARLDELQRWLDSWRAGHKLKLSGPIGIPTSLTVHTSVWMSRDAATVSHMTLNEKLEYGNLYDEFANNEVHRLDERAAWIELGDYDGATYLDHRDLMRLQGLISRARLRGRRMTENSLRFMKRAAQIGLVPRTDPTWPPAEQVICRPILPSAAKAAA